MPSLLITEDNGLTGPLYGDWNDDTKRRNGQVFVGETLLYNFGVAGTTPEKIINDTIGAVLAGPFSIWMRYDGEVNDSYAVVTDVLEEALTEEERALAPFVAAQIKLNYKKVKEVNEGDPIVFEGTPEKFTLIVQKDSTPKDKKNKKMNVVVPPDFDLFKDKSLERAKYLAEIAADVESLPTDSDVPYLLSALTFRRCL